jgi:hypothetical protein
MDWEEAVDELIDARKQIESGQWRIGDLALQIETNTRLL